jgi:16S rRNA (adenine(1408)-N(1))-methyltransferase
MKQVQNRRIVPLTAEFLRSLVAPYAHCLVDVGTGDGRFVYREAAAHPETFCIGIDPVAEAMREISAKVAKKAARGGLPNALYLMDAAESLPGELAGIADRVTVNYPWGSLLRAVTIPDSQVVARLAALGKPGAAIEILLNASVFEDAEYCGRLGVVPVDPARAERELAPAFSLAGIELVGTEEIEGPAEHRTSWGQRLVRGSARRTLRLSGRIGSLAGV